MSERNLEPGIGEGIGAFALLPLPATSDGRFRSGWEGVRSIRGTRDGKVEFVEFERHTLAHVLSSMGYPAYYPMLPARMEQPLKAVLMDLDGTSVHSESFWIGIIRSCVAALSGETGFRLEDEDLPFVSGHSVSEHLSYCLGKYCPDRSLEEAKLLYLSISRQEMRNILEGRGPSGVFEPAPGLGGFLLRMKEKGIRVALVTSGLHEKAWPEIVSAFRTLGLGAPEDFYDAIITAGFRRGTGTPGTLGELSPKPHPWLYAEAARIGLGLSDKERAHVVGIEDSGAGVCSIRLAGFAAIGIAGGNIESSGTRGLCSHYLHGFDEIARIVLDEKETTDV